jgi:hypothetical protein
MHGLSLPSSGMLTSAVSQAVQGFANRASSQLKTFTDDVEAGNVPAAQSFLSTLQQKVTAQNGFATGNALSGQFAQVSSDLQSGNLTAAQSDFANLQLSLSHAKQSTKGATGSGSAGTAGSNFGNSTIAPELYSSNALQQAAYNSALNLSMPASPPSLSVSSW